LDKYLKVFLTRQEESSNFLVIDLGNFSLQISKELCIGFKATSWWLQYLLNVGYFYHQFVDIFTEKRYSADRSHLTKFTVHVIFVNYCTHLSDISRVVALVWPPKGLRYRLVALGRKRLCTTVLYNYQRSYSHQNLASRLTVMVTRISCDRQVNGWSHFPLEWYILLRRLWYYIVDKG